MFTLHIEHDVHDFDQWKAVFDNDPADRKGSGVRRYRVGRSVADPKHVSVDLEFDDAAAAAAMHEKLKGIWAGPGAAVMVNPRADVVEVVETTDL